MLFEMFNIMMLLVFFCYLAMTMMISYGVYVCVMFCCFQFVKISFHHQQQQQRKFAKKKNKTNNILVFMSLFHWCWKVSEVSYWTHNTQWDTDTYTYTFQLVMTQVFLFGGGMKNYAIRLIWFWRWGKCNNW